MFTTSLSVSPATDTIKVGDTLWVTMTVPANVYATGLGKEVKLTGTTHLAFALGFHHVTHTAPFIDGYLKFADPLGNEMNPDQKQVDYRNMELKRSGDQYKLRFGAVPVVAGAYAIDWGGFGSVYPEIFQLKVFKLNISNTDLHEQLAKGARPTKSYYFYAKQP